jgi:transcription elongation factor Elf1
VEKCVYCDNCNDYVEFDTKSVTVNIDMHDVKFSYEAVVPYCKKCGKEVYVDEINDLNIIRAYSAQKSHLEELAGSEEEEDD